MAYRKSIETKLEAIRLLDAGVSPKEVEVKFNVNLVGLDKWRAELIRRGLIASKSVPRATKPGRRPMRESIIKTCSILWNCPNCHQVNEDPVSRYVLLLDEFIECRHCHNQFTWKRILGKSRYSALSCLLPTLREYKDNVWNLDIPELTPNAADSPTIAEIGTVL